MVSLAVDKIPQSSIVKSFEVCGIAENGREVSLENLNERLRNVMTTEAPDRGLQEELPSDVEDDDGAGADSGEEALFERHESEEVSDEDEDFSQEH